MENKELKQIIIDERTGIEYRLVGDFYIPNLSMKQEEKIILNKYGRLRLNYLKKHKKAEYSIMIIDGTINKHLKEIQETAQSRVNLIIEELKAKSNLIEDMKNTDLLYWVGTMNAIKQKDRLIMKNEILPSDYKDTLDLIINKIKIAQQNAAISANYYLLKLYWDVGNVIVEKKNRADWGTGVIEKLSSDLRSTFPKMQGFSARNLRNMRQLV